jgi:hypothetical protein
MKTLARRPFVALCLSVVFAAAAYAQQDFKGQ